MATIHVLINTHPEFISGNKFILAIFACCKPGIEVSKIGCLHWYVPRRGRCGLWALCYFSGGGGVPRSTCPAHGVTWSRNQHGKQVKMVCVKNTQETDGFLGFFKAPKFWDTENFCWMFVDSMMFHDEGQCFWLTSSCPFFPLRILVHVR